MRKLGKLARAVVGEGLKRIAIAATDAPGVDLLLIAFDGAQFYRVFACSKDAAAEGKLDPAMLRDSEMRLKRASPVD